jgi:hypothetical protein
MAPPVDAADGDASRWRLGLLRFMVLVAIAVTGASGFGCRVAPAVLSFAADACAFASLRGQDVGVAGVGVAPAQVLVHVADAAASTTNNSSCTTAEVDAHTGDVLGAEALIRSTPSTA